MNSATHGAGDRRRESAGAEAVAAAAAVEGAEQTKSGLVIEHVKEGVGPFGDGGLDGVRALRRHERSRRHRVRFVRARGEAGAVRRQAGHQGLAGGFTPMQEGGKSETHDPGGHRLRRRRLAAEHPGRRDDLLRRWSSLGPHGRRRGLAIL